MSTTNQLALGVKLSHSELKSRWIKHNHFSGHSVLISQNMQRPKARFFSICSNAPVTGWKTALTTCRAHIRAVGDTRDSMEVVSLELNHTCNRECSGRKRNYFTRDITELSNVLDVYEPATAGNAKQVI